MLGGPRNILVMLQRQPQIRRVVPVLLTLKKFSCPVSLVTNGFYLHVFVFLKKDFWDWSPMQNSRFYFPCSVSVGDWGYVHASKQRRAVRSTGLWSETGGASDDPTSKLRNFLWFYLWVAPLWSPNSRYGLKHVRYTSWMATFDLISFETNLVHVLQGVPTMQTKDKVGMIRFVSKAHACFELKHSCISTLTQIIKINDSDPYRCPSSPPPGRPVPAALYSSEVEGVFWHTSKYLISWTTLSSCANIYIYIYIISAKCCDEKECRHFRIGCRQ